MPNGITRIVQLSTMLSKSEEECWWIFQNKEASKIHSIVISFLIKGIKCKEQKANNLRYVFFFNLCTYWVLGKIFFDNVDYRSRRPVFQKEFKNRQFQQFLSKFLGGGRQTYHGAFLKKRQPIVRKQIPRQLQFMAVGRRRN